MNKKQGTRCTATPTDKYVLASQPAFPESGANMGLVPVCLSGIDMSDADQIQKWVFRFRLTNQGTDLYPALNASRVDSLVV